MNTYVFQRAKPIWAANRHLEKNCELAFRALIPGTQPAQLALAASSIYRCWVNGMFVSAGPARSAHGYYRVDEIDLTPWLTEQTNLLVIEVVGYNTNTFDTLDQPSFLTAEVCRNDKPIAATGSSTFEVYDRQQRIQRVQRYSYQRAFAEAYRLHADTEAFFTDPLFIAHPSEPEIQSEKLYLTRDVDMPQFEQLPVQALVEHGSVTYDADRSAFARDLSYANADGHLLGFAPETFEVHLSDEGQKFQFFPEASDLPAAFPLRMQNGYGLYEFPFDAAGFLRFSVQCEESCTLTILFDEILIDGKVDFLRLSGCNCFRYELDVGTHHIMTFAPYTMKFVSVVVQGCAVLQAMDLIEYKHPPVPYMPAIPADDLTLHSICQAAKESFLSNAVDVFTDCPSRERSGWLCDSFFTARVEYALTGESRMEKAFLENFLLAGQRPLLPEGMLPMCYPADQYICEFIPNWAMWFVLELEEYLHRTGDHELVQRAEPTITKLLNYFAKFENEYGLLERLDGWIFVEWSRANDPDVVQDINYPTNMLYARMLQAAAALYEKPELLQKSMALHQVIRARSLRNGFFTDNEHRTEHGLHNPMNCTEVCQYYAFFTRTASKETDPELWETLVREFGPQRKQTHAYPQVAFANAFVGNYLRLELLYRAGQHADVLQNIRGYFAGMAAQTGTLWEHDAPYASCNHGFASHVLYWLSGIFGCTHTSDIS